MALAFDPENGRSLELWFGRIKKMVVVSATGRRTLRLMSIPVDSPPEGLSLMCTYYSKVPRRPRTYKYGTKNLETDLYHTTNVISVVNFDYNSHDNTYTLPEDQWTHIRTELQRLNESVR